MDPQPHEEPKKKTPKKKHASEAAPAGTEPIAPAALAPEAVPAPHPVEVPAPPVPPAAPAPVTPPPVGAPVVQPKPSAGLAISALVLAIVSVIIGILWFVAAPLAIAAIIMGIIVLAKKMAGKGMGVAAVITGGVSLVLFIPFWIMISLIITSGLQQASQELEKRANDTNNNSEQRQTPSDEQQSNASGVKTTCFSYTPPKGYTDSKIKDSTCNTSVNIKGGDSLTAITVKASGRTDSTDPAVIKQDFSDELRASGNAAEPTFSEKTIGGKSVIVATIKDSAKLDFSMYIVIDDKKSHTLQGKAISTYYISGYSYNSILRGYVEGVVESFKLA